MRIETLSVFPEMFEAPMNLSILGRARKSGAFEFEAHNLRDWTHDRHNTVDDVPFGGGQGMLMKPEPIFEAVEDLSSRGEVKPTVIFFTPVGRKFDQALANELAQDHKRILFVCGRYEGFDERCFKLADMSISLGDYVLTGGELPAMVVTDAIVRLLPGVLGDENSAVDESFTDPGLLEYAQYTRPAVFRDMEAPAVLLSGHHGKVDEWRRMDAIKRTVELRPDLIATALLTDKERKYAEELMAQRPEDSEAVDTSDGEL